MYRRKMEKQTNNVKNVRMLMLPEPSDENKRLLLLPQVQAYNRLTPDKSMQRRTSQCQRQATSTCGTSCPTTATPR
jgi:hypothetical protein